MPERPKDISSEWLLVGEGAGDASLIRYLTESRGINGFQIEDAGGDSRFQNFIQGLAVRPGFDKMKGLIVVADSDGGADESFKRIQKQMKAAKVPIAHAPYKVANVPQTPYCTYVIMLPFSVKDGVIGPLTGALETLLLPAAESHHAALAACLDAWCNCVQMAGWSKTHRDKARLRSLIAAANPDDPNIGLQYAMSPTRNLIPLGHECFDALADLLRSLPAAMRQ